MDWVQVFNYGIYLDGDFNIFSPKDIWPWLYKNNNTLIISSVSPCVSKVIGAIDS